MGLTLENNKVRFETIYKLYISQTNHFIQINTSNILFLYKLYKKTELLNGLRCSFHSLHFIDFVPKLTHETKP
jgi:hypothetical protein